MLRAELHRLIRQKPAGLNITFAISFIIALWSASGAFTALVEGLNVAFETGETRSFLRLALNGLIFTVAGIISGAVAVGIGFAFSWMHRASLLLRIATQVLSWPAVFLLCALVLGVTYRLAPNRQRRARGGWITWGSAVAAILWMGGTQLFTWYARNLGSFNRIYGQLGELVGFLTWIWLSSVILLLGAEIDCELERRAGHHRG